MVAPKAAWQLHIVYSIPPAMQNHPMPQADRAGPPLWRWWLLAAVLLALLLLPWLLFGDWLAASITAMADGLRAQPWAGIGLVVGLLALDPLLPVPSSLVGVAGGGVLGVEVAAMAIWVGQMAGCGLGYWLGRRPGRRLAMRVMGDARLDGLAFWGGPLAPLALVLSRPVPVLAEAVVIMAGAARMSQGPFLASTALANLGLALVYAAAGASGSLLLAATGAAAVPALGWAIWQVWRRRP